MTYAVIMAGGVGTRFWPRSRTSKPKQLLNIFGDRSMIQQTVDRIMPFLDAAHILVVTNAVQAEAIREQLPQLPDKNILIEPIGRNTAPCVGLAASHIVARDPDAVMAVFAADHLISPAENFYHTLDAAVQIAKDTSGSITIGIQPTRPETGYGYIQFLESEFLESNNSRAYRVKAFAEKPNEATAQRFVESGDFLWNSGMFVWKASTILSLIGEHLPELSKGLEKIQSAIGKDDYTAVVGDVFTGLKGISIDYGVMEKTRDVYVLKSDFEWNDVGSWLEVHELSAKDENGNALVGSHVVFDSSNSFVFSPDQTIAMVGVNNLIVVNTGDALLICNRDRTQDVKQVVEILKREKKVDLL